MGFKDHAKPLVTRLRVGLTFADTVTFDRQAGMATAELIEYLCECVDRANFRSKWRQVWRPRLPA